MALHPFVTRGILYDTEKQTARLYQAVDRFAVSNTTGEQYVVVDVFLTVQGEYFYTLIGMKTRIVCTTKFIFDTAQLEDFGFYADCSAPIILPKDFVERLIARASDLPLDLAAEAALNPVDLTERKAWEGVLADSARLSRQAQVVEYSDKCIAIFTTDSNDVRLLKSIRAKYNDKLTWQGRKVVGWVISKSRQFELSKIRS